MSEHEHGNDEPVEPVEPSREEEEQRDDEERHEEPIAAPGEEPGEDEEPAGGEEPPQDSAKLRTEKELEKAYKAIAKLRETVASRLGQIMDGDEVGLIECPLCASFAPGWIWPPDVVPLEAEYVHKTRAVIGMPDVSGYKTSTAYVMCDVCDGLGSVLTGSKVPGREAANCPKCGTNGYVMTSDAIAATAPPNGAQPEPIVTGPTAYGTELPPDLQRYREDGWLIAPPVNIGT